jgi:hypothetical protein
VLELLFKRLTVVLQLNVITAAIIATYNAVLLGCAVTDGIFWAKVGVLVNYPSRLIINDESHIPSGATALAGDVLGGWTMMVFSARRIKQ